MAGPFKMKGPSLYNSPMKQDNTATGGDPKLEKLKAKRITNTKAGKIIKFGEGSNIIADKVKKGVKIVGKVGKKAAKVVGGKTLGILGMLQATSSKADQPKVKKSVRQQTKDLLTKHNLKGGR